MIPQLKNYLQEIGLSDKEAQVLEVLYYYNHLKAVEIAEKTEIQRTTVYAVLKALQKKGLVTTKLVYGVTEFAAIDITDLPDYIQRKKEDLQKISEKIKAFIPQINTIRSGIESFPKVAFFEGKEGVKQAYEHTLEKNKSKKIYVFSGPDIIIDKMGKEYVDYYVKKRTRLGISSYQIAPKTPGGEFINQQDPNFLRVTKLIPEQFSFDTEIVLYDNTVGIFSFSKDRMMAVTIEDLAIKNTLLSLFHYIDQTLETPYTL